MALARIAKWIRDQGYAVDEFSDCLRVWINTGVSAADATPRPFIVRDVSEALELLGY